MCQVNRLLQNKQNLSVSTITFEKSQKPVTQERTKDALRSPNATVDLTILNSTVRRETESDHEDDDEFSFPSVPPVELCAKIDDHYVYPLCDSKSLCTLITSGLVTKIFYRDYTNKFPTTDVLKARSKHRGIRNHKYFHENWDR